MNKYVKVFKESCRKLEEEVTKNTGLSYITFWHDDDIDTIGTVFFDNDDAFHKFYDYLISLKYDIIDNGDVNNIIHDANAEIERWQENYFD